MVVQKLVPAETAGVLFTADPVTGARDRAVISAAWVLGEAVVGGLVTPDSLTVDKESGALLASHVADKAVMTALTTEGTRTEPVPEACRRQAVLPPEQAAALTRLGARIERLFAQPMDVEWTLRDGDPAAATFLLGYASTPIRTLALVRHYLWTQTDFRLSPAPDDSQKVTRALLDHLAHLPCYAA